MIMTGRVPSLSVAATILPDSIGPYLALMGVGFFVAAWGHGMKSRWSSRSG